MSNVISRACYRCSWCSAGLGIAACGSPSGPSAIPSGNQTQGAQLGQSSARAVASGLTASPLGTAEPMPVGPVSDRLRFPPTLFSAHLQVRAFLRFRPFPQLWRRTDLQLNGIHA